MSVESLLAELDIDLDGWAWRADAACAGFPQEWWFPEKGHGHQQEPARRAREICGGCPVQEECLTFAIRTQQPAGLWGGYGIKERRRIGKLRGLIAS